MTWQEFTMKVLGLVLDWPFLALVAVLLFRKPISEAIGRIRSIEGLGVSGTFGDELARVEEEVQALDGPEDQETSQPAVPHGNGESNGHEVDSRQDQQGDLLLAQHAPTGAILHAWTDIERALERLLDAYDIRKYLPKDSVSRSVALRPANIQGLLAERRVIPGSILRPMKDLRALRNQVAHGRHDPTPGEALTYVETAQEVREVLDRLYSLGEKTAVHERSQN